MATLTVAQISRVGAELDLDAADSGGDEFHNTGHEFLLVTNAHVGDARTVSFTLQKTIDGVAPDAREVEVAASTTMLIGPFQPSIYNDGDGMVQVTYSDSAADLTVQAFRM